MGRAGCAADTLRTPFGGWQLSPGVAVSTARPVASAVPAARMRARHHRGFAAYFGEGAVRPSTNQSGNSSIKSQNQVE